jgi:hypothetical protein
LGLNQILNRRSVQFSLRPTPNRTSFAHTYTHWHPARLRLRNCCYSSKHTAYCHQPPDVCRQQPHSILLEQRLERRAEIPVDSPRRCRTSSTSATFGEGRRYGRIRLMNRDRFPVLIDPPVVDRRPLHFQRPRTTGDPPHPGTWPLRTTRSGSWACHFIVAGDLLQRSSAPSSRLPAHARPPCRPFLCTFV